MKQTMTYMLAREEGVTTSELLLPLDRTVRNTEICKFASLNWKIFTVRRDGSIGTSLLPLALMGVYSLRNSIFHYSVTAATKSTK